MNIHPTILYYSTSHRLLLLYYICSNLLQPKLFNSLSLTDRLASICPFQSIFSKQPNQYFHMLTDKKEIHPFLIYLYLLMILLSPPGLKHRQSSSFNLFIHLFNPIVDNSAQKKLSLLFHPPSNSLLSTVLECLLSSEEIDSLCIVHTILSALRD